MKADSTLIAEYKVLPDTEGNRYQFYCDLSGARVCTTGSVRGRTPDEEVRIAWDTAGRPHFNYCSKCGKWVIDAMFNAEVHECVECAPWEAPQPRFCKHCGRKTKHHDGARGKQKVFNIVKQWLSKEMNHTSQAYFEEIVQFGFGPEAMKKIKVCAECGEQTASTAARCTCCEALMPEETLYDVYRRMHRQCGGCGAVLPKDARFCPDCGYGFLSTAD